jgi:hypothetical protein
MAINKECAADGPLAITFCVCLAIQLIFVCTDSIGTVHDKLFVVHKGRPGLIIFVHGLRGSAKETWLNKNTNAYWPQLMGEDKVFERFDIYTASYQAGLNIEELTTQLMGEIDPFFQKYESIVLVTHSMGGLIAKNMLTKLLTPSSVKKLQQIKAILYFGTPAQGADAAWWGQWINWDPQIKDLLPADKNTMLQSIDNNWGRLISERNKSGWKFPKSFCAYETKKTYGLPLVDRTAAHTWCDTDMQGMPYNHIFLVKPESRNHQVYTWARDRILEVIQPDGPAVSPLCDDTAHHIGTAQNASPRVRVSVFKHGGNGDAYGQVIGLLKDRIITIREKLYDSKDQERQYLLRLTECLMDDALPAGEQIREQLWNDTYSLELIDGVVFELPTGVRARSRIYLGSLGGHIKDIPLDILVTPDHFGTLRDLYSLTTIYALLMDAKRLQKPSAVRLHYLHTALALSKDLRPSNDTIKELHQALEEEAKALKSKSIQ